MIGSRRAALPKTHEKKKTMKQNTKHSRKLRLGISEAGVDKEERNAFYSAAMQNYLFTYSNINFNVSNEIGMMEMGWSSTRSMLYVPSNHSIVPTAFMVNLSSFQYA